MTNNTIINNSKAMMINSQINQKYKSARTSINSKKLPAIYKKIKYSLISRSNPFGSIKLLDVGAGKYTEHIREFLATQNVEYFPYDPYNLPDKVNKKALAIQPDVVVCSNVLNVIKEDEVVKSIRRFIASHDCPYFITVYEGNKTGIGKESTKGSWQRNQLTGEYVDSINEIVCKNVISNKKYIYILNAR